MLNNYTANTQRVIGKAQLVLPPNALWETKERGGWGGQSKAMAMTEVMNLLAGPSCN